MPTSRVRRTCAAVGALSCLTLTGCASHQSRSTPTATTPLAPLSISASAAQRSYLGADAVQLATLVPGCDKPTRLTATAVASDAPALKPFHAAVDSASSAAECVLRGHGVVVFGFRSTQNETINVEALSRADNYYAQGTGWSAAPTSTSVPEAERSVVQPVALTLNGEILSGRASTDNAG
jgi:hypothetical protein